MQGLDGFLAFLDRLALPHRASISALTARYGLRRSSYYGWDVVEAGDVKPIVHGQVGALYFNSNNDPDLLPPISFSGFIAVDPDARDNHRKTLDAFSALFGEAPQDKSASNTLGHIWRFGEAALEIVSWPPELNRRHVNPAVARHPELANFCHIRLTTGDLPPLTPEEAAWLADITPFANQGPDAAPQPRRSDPLWNGAGRGLYRRLPPARRGRGEAIGKSRDGQALIGVDETEAFVLARADISAIQALHILPARGPGGLALFVDYADRFSSDRRGRNLRAFVASHADRLDRLADEIAAWAGVAMMRTERSDE
jgi:hypothetical protein